MQLHIDLAARLLQVGIGGLEDLDHDIFVGRDGHLIVDGDADGRLLAVGDDVEAIDSLHYRGGEDHALRLLEPLHRLVLHSYAGVGAEEGLELLLRIDDLVDARLGGDEVVVHEDGEAAREERVGAGILGPGAQVGRW